MKRTANILISDTENGESVTIHTLDPRSISRESVTIHTLDPRSISREVVSEKVPGSLKHLLIAQDTISLHSNSKKA